MNTCPFYEDQFMAALYGELEPEKRADFDAHLEACTTCAQAFARMQETLDLMSQREQPEPNAEYWDTYWEKLAPKLPPTEPTIPDKSEKSNAAGLRVHRRLMLQIASAAAILLIGIFIGQQAKKTTDLQPQITSRNTENVRLVQNYLSRSEALLLGMVHLDIEQMDPQAIDLNHMKNASRQLVREANLVRPQLRPDQQNLQDLISDLEIILMQISNLETEQDVPGVDLIRSSVNRNSILLRINLEALQQINRKSPSDSRPHPSQI